MIIRNTTKDGTSLSTRTKNISVISWNIQSRNGKEGNKFVNEDFLNIINKTDIICLQETRKEVKFRDYRCFNLTRKGTKGGGVAIAVSRSISAGISKVTSLSSVDTIAIKLSKHFFKTNKDIIIINTVSYTHLTLPTKA